MTARSSQTSLDIAIIGLSITSSWGNGHATTYRALAKGLRDAGHRVTFLECDKPWYAAHRDLPAPPFCRTLLYDDPIDLFRRHDDLLRRADAVVVGSYVPDGIAVLDGVLSRAALTAFYDIDTPVTLAGLGRGEETYVARRQIPQLDAYFSFAGGSNLTRLMSDFGARLALALYCSVDIEDYGAAVPGATSFAWDLGYLGTYSPDRQPMLERLLIEPARRLPHRRFVVAGPCYPQDIDWPGNLERIEHLSPAEHPGFYARQRFTLNVTRADMVVAGWSPSVRLFEAAACRTPVISDPWPGLGDLFPLGEAILVARDSDAVVAILEDATPALRDRVAVAAHALVTRNHAAAARAREFIDGVRLALQLSAGTVSRIATRISKTG